MIQTKRDSLEKFIRQQMEGPGACNGRFSCLGDLESDNEEEVINTTPGSLYSTAVLFPQRKHVENVDSGNAPSPLQDADSDLESDSLYQESLDDNSSEELDERVNRLGTDEEDMYSLSQRFPTTIGISCCLDKDGFPILPSDLNITISGRYYKKISKNDYCSIVIKVEDESGFRSFFDNYQTRLEPYFSIIKGGVRLAKDVTNEIGKVKETILSINKESCKIVATNPDGSLDSEYEQIGDTYRYLKSYKERLWRKLKYFKEEYLSDSEQLSVENRIKDVERHETYLSYLEDAMNICNSKSFGFWQSHSFSKTLDLNGINLNKGGKKDIYSPRDNQYRRNLNIQFNEDNEDSDFRRSLSIWLQVTRLTNSTTKKVYLKVQLENSSSPFEEDDNHYFSIVTEKVNERCFFGVKLRSKVIY